jgi:hypothetical protein
MVDAVPRAAGIDEAVPFATKPQLARRMLQPPRRRRRGRLADRR